jgi:hypothetical protein
MRRFKFIDYSTSMRKILWILISVVIAAAAYYFLIRDFEFEASFKAKTLPGDLIETTRFWNRSLDRGEIIEVDSFSGLKQTIVWQNRSYVYDWHFTAVNDSLTEVRIQISEPENRFLNKLSIPFTDTPIEKDAAEIVRSFYDVLQEHLKITDVKLIGEVELDSSFCVCRSLETNQTEKANGMMNDYPLLTSFITTFNL